jgi:hypothetical protein
MAASGHFYFIHDSLIHDDVIGPLRAIGTRHMRAAFCMVATSSEATRGDLQTQEQNMATDLRTFGIGTAAAVAIAALGFAGQAFARGQNNIPGGGGGGTHSAAPPSGGGGGGAPSFNAGNARIGSGGTPHLGASSPNVTTQRSTTTQRNFTPRSGNFAMSGQHHHHHHHHGFHGGFGPAWDWNFGPDYYGDYAYGDCYLRQHFYWRHHHRYMRWVRVCE